MCQLHGTPMCIHGHTSSHRLFWKCPNSQCKETCDPVLPNSDNWIHEPFELSKTTIGKMKKAELQEVCRSRMIPIKETMNCPELRERLREIAPEMPKERVSKNPFGKMNRTEMVSWILTTGYAGRPDIPLADRKEALELSSMRKDTLHVICLQVLKKEKPTYPPPVWSSNSWKNGPLMDP